MLYTHRKKGGRYSDEYGYKRRIHYAGFVNLFVPQVGRLKRALSEAKTSEEGLREDLTAAATREMLLKQRHAAALEEVSGDRG